MHALIVVSNPNPSSFSAAVVEKVRAGLLVTGNTAEVVDLARQGFDPRMLVEDLDYFLGKSVAPLDVREEQERIERADALILIYPLYWWQMPGLLKGWIDRVFQNGWAYGINESGALVGMLRDVPVHVIVHGESDAESAERHGYRSAVLKMIDGIFGFCGISDTRTTFLFEVLSKDETILASHLQTAYDIGRSVFSSRDVGERAEHA